MESAVRDWAQHRGYGVAWGPAGLLDLVRREIEERERSGEIDAGFARENLSFDLDGAAQGWRVLVVVMPRPAHVVTFVTRQRRVPVLLPPTYERYRPTFEDVRRDLSDGPLRDCRLLVVEAPLKAVAARLGAVRYGRNNLAYAVGDRKLPAVARLPHGCAAPPPGGLAAV